MKISHAFKSDIGRKRSQNQDSGGAFADLGLFVIADGMGGHKGGETASQMAVDLVAEEIRKEFEARGGDINPQIAIAQAIEVANRTIYDHAQLNPDIRGMGTTLEVHLFHGGKLTVGHVGDSRSYFLRSHMIFQITRDHSHVQEKLRAGLITRDQVASDPMRNVITRSVGFESMVEVETYEIAARTGDTFLICSDGLTGMMEDWEVSELVDRFLFEDEDIETAVDRLIALANERGGHDNVTVCLTQIL